MSITIRRENSEFLQGRRDELKADLEATFTERDFRDLARMGLLSPEQTKLYDELRRVEFLLGD